MLQNNIKQSNSSFSGRYNSSLSIWEKKRDISLQVVKWCQF